MTSLAAIMEAQARIGELIIRTPVIEDPTGTGLRLKAEHLQRTGSFKLRGASNSVMVAYARGARHVITGSSGNHGQAVAYVAQRLGIKATIVVPEDCNPVKLRGMQQYGARVIPCGTTSTERLALAEQITREEGATFIAPYDDPYVMAGQGTAALEILEQAPDAEAVYVPIGGGGLISGIATAIKESNPHIKVIGVEPEAVNDAYLSRHQGAIVPHTGGYTIADGLRSTQPGSLTFPVMQRYVDEIVLVSEAEIRAAGRFLLEQMKQAVEPSGAVSVAAARRAGGKVVALVSGGSIDLAALKGVTAWDDATGS